MAHIFIGKSDTGAVTHVAVSGTQWTNTYGSLRQAAHHASSIGLISGPKAMLLEQEFLDDLIFTCEAVDASLLAEAGFAGSEPAEFVS